MGLSLSTFVPTIVVRSSVSPEIRVSTAGKEGGGAGKLLQFLRPAVDAYDANGKLITTIAPYGEPSTNGLVIVVSIGLALAAGLFMLGRASK